MGPDTTPAASHNASPSFLLAEKAAYWTLVKKSEDVVLLDLSGRSDVCDYFVICTGQTEVQVRAIASSVRKGLDDQDDRVFHVEGLEDCRWVLLDYVDVVVHVFQPRTRQYYLLERLWGDAPRIEVSDEYFDAHEVRLRHPALPGHPSRNLTDDSNPSDAP